MFSEKILQLNKIVLECINLTKEKDIIRSFTKTGIDILGADYGFVWFSSESSRKFKLVYKSSNLPFEPDQPHHGGRNYKVMKSLTPDFVTEVSKDAGRANVGKYVKSFIIIPICYKKNKYGNIVICYKKKIDFNKEQKGLATTLGIALAQSITIRRLLKNKKDAMVARKKHLEHEQLLKAEKLKAEFISDATHELRTPLSIIRGNVDLALMKKNPKSSLSSLKAVNHEIKHLSDILSDLTLLTSGEAELKRRTDSQTIYLRALVGSIVKRCKVVSESKKISMTVNKMPDMIIHGDKTYIERLFLNLVRNAISYTHPGGRIKISGSVQDGKACVSVADNGIGISSKDLPHIFDRFYRAEKARAIKKKGSTGLGLAISRWVVETHGGSIEVESMEEKGSVFTVKFPLLKQKSSKF